MAVNVQTKKTNWVSRYTAAVVNVANAIAAERAIGLEYTTDAYNGGDMVNRAAYAITDADLAGNGFPYLDAAKLNAMVGGMNAIHAAYDANAGVIEAGRP